MFFPVSKSDIKRILSFEKSIFCFSSIRSDGREECSDHNFAEEFLGKGRKVSAQCAETLKKHIIQKNDLHKGPIVSWMQCWPPRWNFPRSLRGRFINYNFFEKSIFSFSLICSSGHEVFSDYNIAGEFSTKCRKCFVQCKKNGKNVKHKKLICMKFLLSRWMQCWPPRRIFSLNLREWYKNYTFSCKIRFFVFPPYVPMDTKNAVLTTPQTMYLQRTKNFLPNFRERDHNHFFFAKNHFSSKCTSGHQECSFFELADLLPTKDGNSFDQWTKTKKKSFEKSNPPNIHIASMNAV